MEAIMSQIAAMTDEINLLKGEVVQTKAAHAGLHQTAVERNADMIRRFDAIGDRLNTVATEVRSSEGKGAGARRKALIEPKQVNVDAFAGAVNDSRSKFLLWAEKVKDRAGLFDDHTGGCNGESRSIQRASHSRYVRDMGYHFGYQQGTEQFPKRQVHRNCRGHCQEQQDRDWIGKLAHAGEPIQSQDIGRRAQRAGSGDETQRCHKALTITKCPTGVGERFTALHGRGAQSPR